MFAPVRGMQLTAAMRCPRTAVGGCRRRGERRREPAGRGGQPRGTPCAGSAGTRERVRLRPGRPAPGCSSEGHDTRTSRRGTVTQLPARPRRCLLGQTQTRDEDAVAPRRRAAPGRAGAPPSAAAWAAAPDGDKGRVFHLNVGS